MRVVYIGGPYSAQNKWLIEHQVRRAEKLALEVWKLGAVALCPHTMTRHYGDVLPRATWIAGDLELLKRCDALLLVPGWDESAGTRAEVEYASKHTIPVFERLDTLERWLQWTSEHQERVLDLPL